MNEKKTKYCFVTGGVCSGLGKGIVAASLGRLLKARGYRVTIQKFDPYINVDPGTMSPYQHGEVFVTEDGAETDLDLGHYERFIDENLTKFSSIATGKIYSNVIAKERKGDYLGATVQVIPHITDEIKSNIFAAGNDGEYDIVITEIGGTVGDIESLPFLESIRQAAKEVGRQNVVYIHLVYVPYIKCSGELKTKLAQHSVKELLSLGIQPDILICRAEKELSNDAKKKLALFCNVDEECIIENLDAESIYQVPLLLEEQNIAGVVCKKFGLQDKYKPDLNEWKKLVDKELKFKNKKVTIAIVGKYVELHDAYLSIAESLKHAAIDNEVNLEIKWVNSEIDDIQKSLLNIDGILIPGGFSFRGCDGKELAIKYARENNISCFGICLGMQLMSIEFAKNVLKINDATSEEFDINMISNNHIIHIMEDQKYIKNMGGTMRLGSYPCLLIKDSISYTAYKEENINERHRHRYEFNNKYKNIFEQNDMQICGINNEYGLVEIIELKNHKWFVGVQFHPEFKSRPNKPHPLFTSFIKSCIEK
jgi:CTP synthase